MATSTTPKASRRKPPHLTEPYEKPEGEPDGFRMPPPEPSKGTRGTFPKRGNFDGGKAISDDSEN